MPKRNRSGVKQRVLKSSGGVKRRKALKELLSTERAPKMQRRGVEWRSCLSVRMTWSVNKFRSLLPLSLRESYSKVMVKVHLMRVFAEMPVVEGYRFVDIGSFREFVERIQSANIVHQVSLKLKI